MLYTHPERMAWFTLMSAFVLLLLLIGGGTIAGQWFFLRSTVALDTNLKVGLGTVGIRQDVGGSEEAVRQNRDIGVREYVTTDEIAQGYIEFVDRRQENRVVANVVVLPGSQVQLASASRPRFSFGDDSYYIQLDDFEGRLEIEIPTMLPKDIEIVINGTHGQVRLTESGMFHLWSLPDSMTIIPRSGSVLFDPYQAEAVEVQAGDTATFDALALQTTVTITTDELIRNPLFEATANVNVPDAWGCYSIAQFPEVPRGTQNLLTLEGRRMVHIQRYGQFLGNGETGCRQFLGDSANGLDVSGYQTLRIRATMNIKWHSLAVCGSLGSECALMLEITYLNEVGVRQRWIHGFYSYDHGNADVPRTCNSCLINHDRVLPDHWYTYESGNLFDLPEGFRPSRIEQIRWYVSGHEYNVLVGEVALLAER